MKAGIVPCSGIDTSDARWGYSHTNKDWVFGYKLHIVSITDSLIVPLSADVTTANESGKPVYPDVILCLSSEILKKIHYMAADLGFSGKKLYDLILKRGFELVCPVKDALSPNSNYLARIDQFIFLYD